MYFSTMPEKSAIKLESVSKVYKLYGSQGDQLIDVLGLQRFGLKTRRAAKEFIALSDISLDVPRGHRIGIIGRNGAGKTTLLKLICGNFAPTHGTIQINGDVQALMNMGLGFHPDHTGRENVEASLQYNGLLKTHYKDALEGIVEFCELGEFFDQPFKTYSLGMQARLMFAAATAIRPDILIIDEVLGAGDAYFVAKSKARVEGMVRSGCTMLLVSHSMQQVLELCNEAIWLHKGKIRMKGDAFMVVKAYEENLHGPSIKLSQPVPIERAPGFSESESGPLQAAKSPETHAITPAPALRTGLLLQEPLFIPHEKECAFPAVEPPREFNFVSRGGVSRWESDVGLKACGFTIGTDRGETNKLISLRPARFVLNMVAEHDGNFACRYGLVFFDHFGACQARILSPADDFALGKGETHHAEMILNPLQLGPGEYVLSVSIHGVGRLEDLNYTTRYDLLARSFEFLVELPESLAAISTAFFHTAEWRFNSRLEIE
jgi:lipopolysaccharide transport system ATP-binding protein